MDPVLDNPRTRIVVCCGSGGVGKTTTAAALGVRAAERGRKVVVLTIDPARRLAQSMGIEELDNVPRRVPGIDSSAGGELHAMMLDMKRTFDEIVEAHSDKERARAILENPFYQSLSAGFAGTQEYMAMEKLGQLRSRDEWDLIVVDTPPSRSALDFLDAPGRLGSFLDGKLIKLLVAPAKLGGRAGMKFLGVGMSVMSGPLNKLMGAQLLRDVQTFVAAMDTMFGGFRTRADATYRLLQAPGTAFLVVAAPERDALREAAYFVERLAAERMPLAGLVLNRVHGSAADQLTAERALAAAEALSEGLTDDSAVAPTDAPADALTGAPEPTPAGAPAGTSENLAADGIVDRDSGQAGSRTARVAGTDAPTAPSSPSSSESGLPQPASSGESNDASESDVSESGGAAEGGASKSDVPETDASETDAFRTAAGLLRLHAERMQVLDRERRTRDRFTSLHPEVAVAEVAALPGDVHDLAGLREIGERLAAQPAAPAPRAASTASPAPSADEPHAERTE
ncbi:ArsA family ATPase [Streptomyces roseoverticillatus]|uniref:ArsA family ATPase n=1 Tax=Streptomyces roseoverticillatus TaxID=66429 RepID=UPI001F20C9AB|nr:ArsA family ATPase [Streptomyces roseoverticillatus]MCF3100416.1 ArsA family ATPase [Streptomyces roseoverticillatus]